MGWAPYLFVPAKINLVFYHNVASESQVYKKFTITVNISKILGEHDPKYFIFYVADGSSLQDKSLNPKGP